MQDIEKKLWEMADKLRSNMDASEYKHVVLGLLFLKYTSDRFEDLYNKLDDSEKEDRDAYTAENVFYIPEDARWSKIQQNAKNSQIGVIIDDALRAIEKENKSLKGVLDKRYARPDLPLNALGGIIDLVSNTVLYRAKIFDWENPENNVFHVVNQLTIQGQKNCRPDIILYINGLPS